ncbi:MAG TPA: hypothetical protein VMD74_04250 [Candidatus Methylomirabilis sp.]|nr:hypothetical protein [Candidatus Methylomirabilis sp.]
MALIILCFFWPALIVLALIGWGRIFLNLVAKNYEKDLAAAAVSGLSLLLFGGGILNLLKLVGRPALLFFLIGGLIIFLVFYAKLIKEKIAQLIHEQKIFKDKLTLVLLVAVIFLFFLRYVATFYGSNFNSADDYQAYFVFPEKMVQTGSLGSDPFSERKLVSSLGAPYFLDTFILAFFDPSALNSLDLNVGLILLALIVGGILAPLNLSRRMKIFLFLCATMVAVPTVNLTVVLLPAALFLFFFSRFFGSGDQADAARGSGRLIVIALAVAAILQMKNSLALMIISAFCLYYAAEFSRGEKKKVLAEFFGACALILILLSPWMIALHRSSGTFFYPLLGRGLSGVVYGNYSSANAQLTRSDLLSFCYEILKPFFLVFYFSLICFYREIRKRRRLFCLFILVGINILINAYATSVYGLYRYIFAYLFAFDIFVLWEMLKQPPGKNPVFPRLDYRFCAIIILAIILGNNFPNLPRWETVKYIILENKLVAQSEKLSYQKMQDALPAGATVITRLDKPFLLDFKRNTIFIADYPGGASLPPGLPFQKGPEELADYLLGHSLKYVAYSYGDQAGFSREQMANRLEPMANIWIRTEAEHALDFQDNLSALSKTRKIIYDDGKNFILDLSVKNN